MIVKPKIIRDTGDYLVRFHYLDIENGELVDKIVERYVNAGDTAVAPGIPTSLSAITKKSCDLTFNSWNHTDFTNIQRDLEIGAIYNTTDTKTHVFITLNTSRVVPIYFTKSDSSTLTISWGDGSANYTTTSSGSINTIHTYATAGIYEITMWISSGTGTYSFGNGSDTTSFIGGNDNVYRNVLSRVFIGSNVTSLEAYAFYLNRKLNILTLNSIITTLSGRALALIEIESISIPKTVTTLGDFLFLACRRLKFLSFSETTIENFGINILSGTYNLNGNISLPNFTNLGSGVYGRLFGSNTFFNKITFHPNTVTLPEYSIYQAYNISEIILPTSLTTIEQISIVYCEPLVNITIPSTVTSMAGGIFQYCESLQKITIPSGVNSIGDYTFNNCYRLKAVTIKRFTAPSTITTLSSTNAFSGVGSQLIIYVPVGSGSVYKGATNWSTYANQIYEDTPENRAIFGD